MLFTFTIGHSLLKIVSKYDLCLLGNTKAFLHIMAHVENCFQFIWWSYINSNIMILIWNYWDSIQQIFWKIWGVYICSLIYRIPQNNSVTLWPFRENSLQCNLKLLHYFKYSENVMHIWGAIKDACYRLWND